MAVSAVTLLPYADFLGIEAVGEQDGAPLLRMPFAAGLGGAPGILHGGAIAGLLEIAAIAAIDATLEDGGEARAIFKPVTVTVDFMRPGAHVDTFACARLARRGGRIANIEASAWQDDVARPVAVARMNLLIRNRMPA